MHIPRGKTKNNKIHIKIHVEATQAHLEATISNLKQLKPKSAISKWTGRNLFRKTAKQSKHET